MTFAELQQINAAYSSARLLSARDAAIYVGGEVALKELVELGLKAARSLPKSKLYDRQDIDAKVNEAKLTIWDSLDESA